MRIIHTLKYESLYQSRHDSIFFTLHCKVTNVLVFNQFIDLFLRYLTTLLQLQKSDEKERKDIEDRLDIRYEDTKE
jgi:hypothetical protein